MNWVLLTAVLCVALLAGLVALRGLSGGRLEVKLTDAVIAVIPVVLLLLFTGQIQKLVLSGEGITIETAREAILDAAARPVEAQVSPLPVVPVDLAAKGGVGEIRRLAAEGKQGLTFQLGFGGYYGGAIREYLETLTQYPTFRYVVLDNPDGALLGVIDARKLAAILEQGAGPYTWDSFADMLNAGNEDALRALPGLIPADAAVPADANKQQALARMEKLDADWLPVVNERGEFTGIVDRSRVTASLILDVAAQLERGGDGQP